MAGISKSQTAIPVYLVNTDPANTAGFGEPLVPGASTATAGGYRQVTTLTASTGLPTVPAGTRRAIIQAQGQGIRWRDDGTAPTATVGMLIPAGGELRYDGADMSAFRMIEVAASAVANISYYS